MSESNKILVHNRKNKKHRIRMRKHFQWKTVVTITLSSITIVLMVSDIIPIKTCDVLTHAFVFNPAMTRSPLHAQAISSRLTTDLAPLTTIVPPNNSNDLKFSVTCSTKNGAKSLSSFANVSSLQIQRLEATKGLLSQRRPHNSRYGGRAISFSSDGNDGDIYSILNSGRLSGKSGVLGFDIGLHMVSPSSSSLIPQIDAEILGNPNSPIKKQQHEMSFIPNGSFEDRNSMLMSSYSSVDDNGRSRGDGSTALINRRRGNGPDITRTRSSTNKASVAPAWFPYIPTRSQILSLKLDELKGACGDRNISKTGRKIELQERLLTWVREQHRRRFRVRQNGNNVDKVDTENEESGKNCVDPLIARRKALLRANENKVVNQNRLTERELLELDADEAIILGALSDSRTYLSYLDNIIGTNSKRHRIQESKSISSVSKKIAQQKNADDRKRRNAVISSSSPSIAELSFLTKTFNDSPNNIASSNNYQIQQLYLKAKHADQRGDLSMARNYLVKLRKITGEKDTRVLRRLARLEDQCGNYHEARAILQRGLRVRGKDDAYLLQGLGKLSFSRGDVDGARNYYKRAVAVAPKGYANPFHALGTLEYSVGNIHDASRVLRRGLNVCPTNHRLHHALGELYREAKMTQLAETEYRKGLECIALEVIDGKGKANTWGKGFFYTALGYLEYERENIDGCRSWLWKSVNYDGSNLMYDKGWLALAQLEQSEGRIDIARKVYKRAIGNYEKKRGILWSEESKFNSQMNYERIAPLKMGDQWLHVYNSWVSMEQNEGASYDELNNLHSRIAAAFPDDWKNLQRWAKLQVTHAQYGRARTLYQLACDRAGRSDAEPYRLSAEFEMSLSNHHAARAILFRGAQSMSKSPDGAMSNSVEFSKLYHTWAVCEWHLNNLDRAETLFDHALRLTNSGEGGSPIRSLYLYSIARLLFQARDDCTLAQHCVCLSLSENSSPNFSVKSDMWNLWADIATKMGNPKLAINCRDQAEKVVEKGNENSGDILNLKISTKTGGRMHELLRKPPWHHKLDYRYVDSHDPIQWYNKLTFPLCEQNTNALKKSDNRMPDYSNL